MDEAGSETVAFLKSLDVLAKKEEKVLHDVRFACLKNWFARSAWYEKLHFIVDLLHCCEGTSLLRQLLICIARSGTKDAIFLTYMQSGGSLYDRILMDDNRDLDPDTLSNVRTLDQIWFMGLEEDDKLSVLIGLLLIGGGILSYRVYKEALHILEERQNVNAILNMESIFPEEPVEKEESTVQVTEEINKKKKGKKKMRPGVEKTTVSIVTEGSKSEEMKITEDLSPEEAALKKEIENLKAVWESKMNAIRKSMVEQEIEEKKSEKIGKKGRYADKAENLDMLQLMPSSICKAVVNMLDLQSVTNAKKVNNYWASVVDNTLKDKVARHKLDKVISKLNNIQYPSHLQVPEIPKKSSVLSPSFFRDKPFSYSAFSQSFSGNSMKNADSGFPHTTDILHPSSVLAKSVSNRDQVFQGTSPIQEKGAVGTSSLVQEELSSQPSSILHVQSFSSPLDITATRSRRISFHDEAIKLSFQQKCMLVQAEILELFPLSQQSANQGYKEMYSNKHSVVIIINDFLHLRIMACGSGHRLMAVSDENHNVIIFSLITGAKLTPCLTGHKNIISHMQFHPDGNHIITASIDNTVRCWDVWRGQTVCSYIGHGGKITATSISEEHVIVGSEDKLLRVYHVWSAFCLDSWQSNEVITALKLVGDGKNVYIGQKNGDILMYNYNTHIVQMTRCSHILEVSGMHLYESLLLSCSYDGFVKVWKVEKLAFKQLIELDHDRAVMSVNMVSMQVVSGCHGGYLWVWCLLTGALIRKFQVWTQSQPIYHIYCANEKDHVKIVVSAEVGIKVYGFQPRGATSSYQGDMKTPCKSHSSKYSSTKQLKPGLKNTTLCEDLGQPARIMLKMQRLKALDIRGSVDQSLRYPMNMPSTKSCLISKLCDRWHSRILLVDQVTCTHHQPACCKSCRSLKSSYLACCCYFRDFDILMYPLENKMFNPEICNLTSFPRLATTSELYKLPLKLSEHQCSMK